MSIEIIDIEDTGLESCSHSEKYHQFSAAERASVRNSLLGSHRFTDSSFASLQFIHHFPRSFGAEWYTANRRRLPWRGDSPPFAAAIEVASSAPSAPAMSGGIASFFQVKPKVEKQTAPASASESKPEIKPEVIVAGSSDIFPLTPWPNAYATWVSEIMLQQTRVATVIEYFTKWMRRFPTVHALAAADPEEVNAMWAGLGYYRRARMLHQGAKMVVETLNGQLPDNVTGLKQIPGIGDYTAGAIASIAYNQQAPLVDGNVIRVFCRMRGIAAHPKHKQALKLIWYICVLLCTHIQMYLGYMFRFTGHWLVI
jgi:A/G-specific adenine glycosylase